jgi:hypothetical protein
LASISVSNVLVIRGLRLFGNTSAPQNKYAASLTPSDVVPRQIVALPIPSKKVVRSQRWFDLRQGSEQRALTPNTLDRDPSMDLPN